MRRIAQHAYRAAEVECTLLISGETGTGKEVWARAVHRSGRRASQPFVPVNCAALTSTLAESQLFGHEKGSFTGALGSSLGIFRAAQGGVVFLDEVGEMPLELQPKLLRVLQQREVTPVGAAHPVPIDVQVLAATNRDLAVEVAAGRFREDLYYRLNMVELRMSPLRQRIEDIPELIEFFSSPCNQVSTAPVAAGPEHPPQLMRILMAGKRPAIVARDRAILRARFTALGARRLVRPARFDDATEL
jgi:transcriptional regulator with GAF, ATPase, and Fis domain